MNGQGRLNPAPNQPRYRLTPASARTSLSSSPLRPLTRSTASGPRAASFLPPPCSSSPSRVFLYKLFSKPNCPSFPDRPPAPALDFRAQTPFGALPLYSRSSRAAFSTSHCNISIWRPTVWACCRSGCPVSGLSPCLVSLPDRPGVCPEALAPFARFSGRVCVAHTCRPAPQDLL